MDKPIEEIHYPILDLDHEEFNALASEWVASSVVLALIKELRHAVDYNQHLNEQLLVLQRRYWDLKLPTIYREEWERKALKDADNDSNPANLPYR